MPTVRIPLVGQVTQRNFATPSSFSKDQSFRGVVPVVLRNPVTGQTEIALEKRTGWFTSASGAGSTLGSACWAGISNLTAVVAFGDSTSTIYTALNGSVGTLTSSQVARHINEVVIGGITYVLISATDGTTTSGWYLASDSISQTSYTGTLTSGSPIVPSIASTAGMYSGQAISGTGIPASTVINSVDSSTQITMSANATANGAQTITKTPLAKIIHANFPTSITGQFVELDGYVFILDQNGKIWNSTINTVATWSATGFKSADTFTDGGLGLAKDGHRILALGRASGEWFYNAGYQTGSPLEKTKEVFGIGSRTSGGATSGYSICQISDACGVVCWINGVAEVYINDGGPKKISTPPVSTLLRSSAIFGITTFRSWGHTVISIPIAGASLDDNLLYFVELGLWTLANFPTAIILSASTTSTSGVPPHTANGFIYSGPATTYSDGSSAVTSVVQTGRIDHETDKRKFVSEIRLEADDQSSGTVTLECSDDDYGSWVTLGTFDLTSHTKKITRCGSYKGGRAYRLTHATAAAFRWKALEITYTVGTS